MMKPTGTWVFAVTLGSAIAAVGCSKDETPASSAVPPAETAEVQTTPTGAAAIPKGTMRTRATTATTAVNVQPKGTSTKPSVAIPKPDKKLAERIASYKDSSADTGEKCTAAEEGMAACLGTYNVFCTGGEVRALDCSLFVNDVPQEATCGEIDGEVNCGWDG